MLMDGRDLYFFNYVQHCWYFAGLEIVVTCMWLHINICEQYDAKSFKVRCMYYYQTLMIS